MTKEITFEIVKHITALGEASKKGWSKELNVVKWGDGEAKYDIRDWNKEHTHMSKGITLTEKELKKLVEVCFTIK